jgi:hypothetical protein
MRRPVASGIQQLHETANVSAKNAHGERGATPGAFRP